MSLQCATIGSSGPVSPPDWQSHFWTFPPQMQVDRCAGHAHRLVNDHHNLLGHLSSPP